MTDLQIGLAVIGGVAVVAVVVYNRWQERSARREAQKAFTSPHSDVLLDGRREPTLPVRRDPPAENVDYVIALALTGAASPAELREGWSEIERRFSRRVFLDEHAPSQARAALQLISREGVINDAEVLEFRSMVETLGTRLGATVRAPEMRAALDAARSSTRPAPTPTFKWHCTSSASAARRANLLASRSKPRRAKTASP